MVEQFTGIGIDIDELGGAANLARYTGVPATGRRRSRRGDRRPSRRCSPTCPTTSTSSRSVGTPTIRRIGRAPRPATCCRRRRPAATTCARSPRRSSTTGSLLELRERWAANTVTAFATIDGRPGRHRREPADLARRHARHSGFAEGGALRRVLRCVQPADHHPRRHAWLLPRQGPRVARHDPPRSAARVRVRTRHRCHGSASSSARATAARSS